MTCEDCADTGSVPAGGGEAPGDVDNGYVRCPSCSCNSHIRGEIIERTERDMTTKAKTTTITGDVESVDHAATSRNGNPTYRVTLTDGRSFLTGTDSQVGYAATNYRPHSLRLPVSSVVITLDGRGRIVDMRRPDGTDA